MEDLEIKNPPKTTEELEEFIRTKYDSVPNYKLSEVEKIINKNYDDLSQIAKNILESRFIREIKKIEEDGYRRLKASDRVQHFPFETYVMPEGIERITIDRKSAYKKIGKTVKIPMRMLEEPKYLDKAQ